MLTPQQVAEKWRANTSNAQQAFKDGVNGVQTAPGQRAAAAADRFLAGVQASVSSGRWQQKVAGVSLESWKASMVGKGAARIAGGVAAAVPKMQDFMTRWLPYEADLSARIAAMPKGDLASAQARANFAIAYNAAFSKRLPGS